MRHQPGLPGTCDGDTALMVNYTTMLVFIQAHGKINVRSVCHSCDVLGCLHMDQVREVIF